MSEDVLSVMTPYADVAELGQGYMQRADGERLWVPLSAPATEGVEVRFVVHLADGTPAFAGAGQCVQVADQGEGVDPAIRYEALLDSLQFDERSQPVYDYIVAVRGAALEAAGGFDDQDETVAAEVPVDVDAGYHDVSDGEAASIPPDPTEEFHPAESETFADAGEPDLSEGGMGAEEPTVVQVHPEMLEEAGGGDPMPADVLQLDGAPPADGYATDEPGADLLLPSVHPPEPIPTGILKRPAIATHWRPAPGVRPDPAPSTGLFQYAAGEGLPRPPAPPRPELDPAYVVQPAPHPRDASESEVSGVAARMSDDGHSGDDGLDESEPPVEMLASLAPEGEVARHELQEDRHSDVDLSDGADVEVDEYSSTSSSPG